MREESVEARVTPATPSACLVLLEIKKIRKTTLITASSYLGSMGDETNFHLKLIPDFDGSGTQSVVEWIEKLELVCKLRNIKDVASVLPPPPCWGCFCCVPAAVREGQDIGKQY